MSSVSMVFLVDFARASSQNPKVHDLELEGHNYMHNLLVEVNYKSPSHATYALMGVSVHHVQFVLEHMLDTIEQVTDMAVNTANR